jgi:hypothetical protein
MLKDKRKWEERQGKSVWLEGELYRFLQPLLWQLNEKIDRRLVGTFLGLVMAILIHRHRNHGLLLSELGSYLLGPERGRAGTRRISNLIHSEKWEQTAITDFLWQQGTQRVQAAWEQGERLLVIWDESVIEKPESLQAEGLCPVRSTKAVRLKRIKPGFFNPPGGRPIFVPGFPWLQILVLRTQGPPTLAHLRWWSTRGERKTDKRSQEQLVLRKIDDLWGKEVLPVWDRGFAGRPWLSVAFSSAARFVIRWPKHYQLMDLQGNLRKAWEINRGQRSWEHRYLWDARRRCYRKTGIIAYEVLDPDGQVPLWLVVARRGQGQTPWYLLTTEPIRSAEEAWSIVFAYARRWQVEMAIRFHQAELAFESLRLEKWHHRCKLLLIGALTYAFLFSLLDPKLAPIVTWLLRTFCHRSGKRSPETSAPLYRLRNAIHFFWLTHPPPFLSCL